MCRSHERNIDSLGVAGLRCCTSAVALCVCWQLVGEGIPGGVASKRPASEYDLEISRPKGIRDALLPEVTQFCSSFGSLMTYESYEWYL